MNGQKILVIDDEPSMRRALKVALERCNYQVQVASDGEEGLNCAAMETPDVVILDLAMPGTDGFETCKQLREWSSVPVLVLSVHDAEQDKVRALDIGADDFLTKPFGVNELTARIRALIRRAGQDPVSDQTVLSYDGLIIDLQKRSVSIDSTPTHLTPTEYDLLRYLALNADRVLTHRQLLTRIWGAEFAEENHTLRVHMFNLRNKIEPDPERPRYIHTEPRVGYRFSAVCAARPAGD